VVEQIIRPTGLVDPEIVVRKVTEDKSDGYPGQVRDFIEDSEATIKGGGRVLVTTLTKQMAEDLSDFLKERGLKSEYIHSDIKTIERITILSQFRRGVFDCLVGVNLLREGLDLPEVELVSILDADKEGFLRSETSLIQTIGRAARNVKGRVVLYADGMTKSLDKAIGETNRRRAIQVAYNTKHNITPLSVKKLIKDITDQLSNDHKKAVTSLVSIDKDAFLASPKKILKEKRDQMEVAVEMLDFETAALIRDEIKSLEALLPKKK
jgi:excinuclease ABC subunit B